MITLKKIWLLTMAVLIAAAPGAARAATRISGQVRAGDGGPLAGIVLLEKGRLYGKDFRYGGLVKDGRFAVDVPEGGDYGLHLYATGYVYFPLAMEVMEGAANTGSYSLPPNPAGSHAPSISGIRFEEADGTTVISLLAEDPDGDLSHQVLALDAGTGRAYRMSPPSFVFPFARNYPDGRYTLRVGRETVDPRNWYFVAADNKCYNSPVLGYPFDDTGVIAARSGKGSEDRPAAPGSITVDAGKSVFGENCAMCHYRDSAGVKVGPGLKGLYRRKRTPVLELPVTDDSIRKQIREGGRDMPPYSHLHDADVEAVLLYLKTL